MSGAGSLPRAGEVLSGKYRIEGILGSGGMASVFAARHLELDQLVAVKFLHPHICGDAKTVSRFLREGRAAAKIQSEHVARVTDVGRLPGGTPFLVMEYLEGSDLARLVKAEGQLSLRDAVDYVVQVCDAVAIAHSLGIVHRDLKPANLFLTRRVDGTPCVKVLDFGISKLLSEASASEAILGATVGVIGSPMYMSPEQMASSREVDRRTDIWALGMILFKLLTGKVAYDAKSLVELSQQIARQPPIAVRRLRPEIPPGLAVVVMRCLERDREQRYSTIGELAAALAEFASPSLQPLVRRIVHVAEAPPQNEPFALSQSSSAPEEVQEIEGDTAQPSSVSIPTDTPHAGGHLDSPSEAEAREPTTQPTPRTETSPIALIRASQLPTLVRAAAAASAPAPQRGLEAPTSAESPPRTEATTTPVVQRRSRRRWLAIAGFALALPLAIAAVVVVVRPDAREKPRERRGPSTGEPREPSTATLDEVPSERGRRVPGAAVSSTPKPSAVPSPGPPVASGAPKPTIAASATPKTERPAPASASIKVQPSAAGAPSPLPKPKGSGDPWGWEP